MRTLIFISLLMIVAVAADEKLLLKNGKQISTKYCTFSGNKINLNNGQSFSKNEIREIYFLLQSPKKELHQQKVASNVSKVSQEIKKILEDAKQYAKKYPDAGFIGLLHKGEYHYQKNGQHSFTYHLRGMIQKESHKGYAFGGSYFTKGRERIELLFARTIKKDGTVVPLDRKKNHYCQTIIAR